jgi:uncharacterized protein YjbI with pentapeptide repeats
MARADRMPRPQMPSTLTPHDGAALEEEGDYEAIAFTDLNLADQAAPNVRLLGCALTGCTLTGCALPAASLRDVTIERLRAVGVDLSETSWLNVIVSDGLMTASQLFDAQVERLLFRDCKLDAVNFRGATLVDVRFEGCTLQDPDFGGATLRRVTFQACRLVAADFTNARMEQVDLRGSELDVARGYDGLRGAIVDSAQVVTLAPALAQQLGITVRDGD